MPVKFCPISSGSNGNCTFIGTDNTKILIDAGLSGVKIEKGLSSIGVDCKNINGIFITHEHSDHIQSVGILSRRHNIPIFATATTWRYIDRHQVLGKIVEKNKRIINPNEECELDDLIVRAFEIPHDSIDPVGYTITTENHKLSVATDIGHVTDIIKENIYDSDVILIESNHDVEMLVNGKYPQLLKDRVLGKRGHLSNVSAGQLLTEIITKRLKYVFLGHLSEENNRPLIALDTVTRILQSGNIQLGVDLQLYLAQRGAVSEALILD